MRTVRDVHARTVHAPAGTVGALLDRLAGDDDPLFPVPVWPAMRFDRPLGVGAAGGHGFVRYRVTAYEPGRRVRFDFPDGGHHAVEVTPLDAGSCRVTHVLENRPRGAERVAWPLAVRWVHATVVEEVLDNVERAATGTVRAPARRSPYVRLLNRLLWARPAAVAVPAGARLARTAFARTDFQDAWQLPLPPGMPRDPAAWKGVLRGAFPEQGRATTADGGELLLGKDARHLDFRASILVESPAAGADGRTAGHGGRVTLSTVVRTHHAGGRLYFALVRRVHPVLARAMLRRTHRRLALAAPSAGEREWAARAARAGYGHRTRP
ncbi:DUF2867 domain-containing protein [Streptomyces albofaciens JCM 4342]|uniref:DUF2867 domain-containing protein n=1 Tax=Streptomyces albofaciens TaxID=66866 RepID=UPI00123B3432|nr:DUF2867 domain-containing protein [Streptomyces albofaciens]KAA6213060.1 DUF2867 domain-containing protein [Streptomyces albofaciens JCM 4342]